MIIWKSNHWGKFGYFLHGTTSGGVVQILRISIPINGGVTDIPADMVSAHKRVYKSHKKSRQNDSVINDCQLNHGNPPPPNKHSIHLSLRWALWINLQQTRHV